MAVQVKAAGHLRHRMPANQAEIRLDDAPSTVQALLDELGLTKSQVWIVRINGESVKVDHPIADGDYVELFPLVGGG